VAYDTLSDVDFGGGNVPLRCRCRDEHAAWRRADWRICSQDKRIIITKYVDDEPSLGIQMMHPLCHYPKVPRYSGTGDMNDANTVVCVDSNSTNNPVSAPEYLQ
jgi:hypothetical protein